MTELDTVVLKRDVPEVGLQAGDIGAIVHVYPKAACEVEFVTGGGETVALLTVRKRDLRPLGRREVLHARSPRQSRV